MRRRQLSPAQYDALDAVYEKPKSLNWLLGHGHQRRTIRSLERRRLVVIVDHDIQVTPSGRAMWVDESFPITAEPAHAL